MRRGFTLVELLVAITVMGVVMALLSPMVLSSRKTVQSDQLRTAVNQSLRGGSDMIGADIRTAGERFPPGAQSLALPPIVIEEGDDDTPDQLILRRNLWEGTLAVCQDVTAGTAPTRILVIDENLVQVDEDAYAECGQPINDDGWPENLAQLKALADSIGEGGVLFGYIFNPAIAAGEFIRFKVPDDADSTGEVERAEAPIPVHAQGYPLGSGSRIYVLEERRYRVGDDDILELLINDAPPRLPAVADVVDLRARYVLADGSTATTVGSWRDIRAVELTLKTNTSRGPEQVERELTSRFFPRNILSR